jgi:hypothetical protein
MKVGRFKTRLEVERYFGGSTIQCLLCGKRFARLSSHLDAKHDMTTDDYKARYGLPWHRGLTSLRSHAKSGWDAQRRAKQSRLALKTKFFRFPRAHRREIAPFLKAEAKRNLAPQATGFGKDFERQVRALFNRGLVDAEIAKRLHVARMTVNVRTRRWRKAAAPANR